MNMKKYLAPILACAAFAAAVAALCIFLVRKGRTEGQPENPV